MRENALPIPIGAARLRRSFGQAFIYRGLGALAGYLTVLLLARFAAPQDFGWFATALAIITLGPSVAGAGQPMAVLRFVRRGTARTGSDDRFLRASASVNVIGAVTTGLALAVIGELSLRLELLSAPPGLFLWTGLAVAALTALEWASAVLRAQGRLSEAFIPREILWRVGCLAGIIFCLSTGQGIDARLTLAMIAVSLLMVSSAGTLRAVAAGAKSLPAAKRGRSCVPDSSTTNALSWLCAARSGCVSPVLSRLSVSAPAAAPCRRLSESSKSLCLRARMALKPKRPRMTAASAASAHQ